MSSFLPALPSVRRWLVAFGWLLVTAGTARPSPSGLAHAHGHGRYFVSPTAAAGGTGSESQPWTLEAALAGGMGRLQPGDTVWLHGGTYRGEFRTELAGSPGRWIVFRGLSGERATIDGTLRADGAYLTFWGFEIMQSTPGTYGLQANTANGRFINLVIHDAGTQGVSFWTPAVDAELYGCIIYNNGTHENLDHGVYVHNETGTKLIADNVFFNNLARGIQVYASRNNPVIRNIRVEGNVAFNNGTISAVAAARENLIFNAPVPTEGMSGIGNLLYFSGREGINLRVGKYAPQNNRDIVLRDNYAAGGKIGLEMIEPWARATVENNEFIDSRDLVKVGGSDLAQRYQWSHNRWGRDPTARAWQYEGRAYDWNGWRQATGLGGTDQTTAQRPSVTKVFVRPNTYEPGRATVVIYNWGGEADVAVDVSGVLHDGDAYEVHNVQALFGPAVVSGTYHGGAIRIPMAGTEPPAPLGRITRTPPRTGPAFDVFLLTRASS
jgi:parallel beta-helix repeat protein